MVAAAMICEEANRHEVEQLGRVPEVEILRVAADEISTDEDVHNAEYEGYFFPQTDGFGIVPLLAQLVDTLAHTLSVPVELFVGRW